jgi:YD repeat-containing protein
VNTSYSGNCKTVTDEAQKARKSCYDGFGRLTGVWEDPAGANYETDYQYDLLNNLTLVTQSGSRQRSFVYDSLSRLTKATNPESGAICYAPYSGGSCQNQNQTGYDANGNLLTRTDARNITTTYSYDALNRISSKSFSDGTPVVWYLYDGYPGLNQVNLIGRLAFSGTNNGGVWLAQTLPSYDAMGRVAFEYLCTTCSRGWGFEPAYSYDYLGDMTSYTNGAYGIGTAQGVTFTQAFDTTGRLTKLTSTYSDSQHPATLTTVDSSTGYWPNGAMRKMTLGIGLTETTAYNNRLQPCLITVNSSGLVHTRCTDDVLPGNQLRFTYFYNESTADNGTVAQWAAVGAQAFDRYYIYDSLNRLSTLSDIASNQSCKGLSWTYDPWGNRTDQTVTKAPAVPHIFRSIRRIGLPMREFSTMLREI